jgi:triacylglycerol lipase
VVLVHGLGEDAAIWQQWEGLLHRDGIPYYTITFQKSDDKCGAAIGHATELTDRIQGIKTETGTEKINIVGHSKGGIDARVYLANGTNEVENLIMIGTPNAGTRLAETTNICSPAIWDVLPGANATMAKRNPNTKYWTIAGDWQPNIGGNPALPGADDGQVTVASVESEGYFEALGRTGHPHLELLGEEEYNLARGVLVGLG